MTFREYLFSLSDEDLAKYFIVSKYSEIGIAWGNIFIDGYETSYNDQLKAVCSFLQMDNDDFFQTQINALNAENEKILAQIKMEEQTKKIMEALHGRKNIKK